MSNSFLDFVQKNRYQDVKENSRQESNKLNRRKEHSEYEIALQEKLSRNKSFKDSKYIIGF